jgi:hypothetical protein
MIRNHQHLQTIEYPVDHNLSALQAWCRRPIARGGAQLWRSAR